MAKKREKHKYISRSDKEEITLALDSYGDIFSDFDPRGYAQKAVSDDFLQECKNASRDKNEGLELNFLIPKKQRNKNDENLIRQRLKNHFQRHYLIEKHIRKNKIRQGIMWAVIGVGLLFFSSFIHLRTEYIYNLMIVISEPAGWFVAWTGLDNIFSTIKEESHNYRFYSKMSKAKISFFNY